MIDTAEKQTILRAIAAKAPWYFVAEDDEYDFLVQSGLLQRTRDGFALTARGKGYLNLTKGWAISHAKQPKKRKPKPQNNASNRELSAESVVTG
jgi:hypothetical protein